jgi:hypothetical protein
MSNVSVEREVEMGFVRDKIRASKEARVGREAEFAALWKKASEAGQVAATAMTPVPMIVGQAKSLFSNEIDYSQKTYFEPDGVCGFAWVQVKPGTSAFAKWLKKMGYARSDDYYGGVSIWVSDYNQSMQRKEAHARAMARVFSDAGINAYPMSRMD